MLASPNDGDGQKTKSNEQSSNVVMAEAVSSSSSSAPNHPADTTNLPPDSDPDNTEDASISPTLKAHSSPSRRKVNESSFSDAGLSSKANGNGTHKASSISRGSLKPSFFSRLFRAVMPCISPAPASHPIEFDLTPVKPALPAQEEKEAVITQDTSVPNRPMTPVESTQTSPQDTIILTPAPENVSAAGADTPQASTAAARISPQSGTEGIMSGDVVPPGSTGGPIQQEKTDSRNSTAPSEGDESEDTSFTDDDMEDVNVLDIEDDDVIINGGAGIPIGPDGVPRPLLPPISPQHAGRKCLVLDLDETLVHSSFKSIQQADYVVPVEIEYHLHNVYVIKRPGVDNFLKKMGEIYEVVVFTASLSKYADPVLDKLDIHQVVSHRLFRESCYNHKGNYVKDLSQLGRPITDTIILDNSPASYIFHPNNAVPVSSWFNDPHDTELTDLVPFLADLSSVDDVRGILDGGR